MTEHPPATSSAAVAVVDYQLPDGESFPVWKLAQLFHVHRTHICNLIESGSLKCAIDLRGRNSSRSCVRVSRAAVLEFIEARKIDAIEKLERRGEKQVRIAVTSGRKHARKH